MREDGDIGLADGADRGHAWSDAAVEHLDEQLDRFGLDAGRAVDHRVEANRHRGAYDRDWRVGGHAGRVRAEEPFVEVDGERTRVVVELPGV